MVNEQKAKKSPVAKIIGGGCVLILLFVVVIGACSAIFMSGGDDSAPPASDPPAAAEAEPAEEEAPAEEEEVVEEEEAVEEEPEVLIVADNLERTSSIGMEGMQDEAQGEYVVVDVTVTNNSGEEITISNDDFTLVGVDGTEYGISSDWPITEETPLIFESVNPGNSVSGYILFDIPVGTEIGSLQYEALFSFDGPTEVALP